MNQKLKHNGPNRLGLNGKAKHPAYASPFAKKKKKSKGKQKGKGKGKSKQKFAKYIDLTVTDTVSETGTTVTATVTDPDMKVVHNTVSQNVNMTSPFSTSSGTFTVGQTGEGGVDESRQDLVTQIAWAQNVTTQSAKVADGTSASVTTVAFPGKANTGKRTHYKHNKKKSNFTVTLKKKGTKKITKVVHKCKIRPPNHYTAWNYIQQLINLNNHTVTSHNIDRNTDGSHNIETVFWNFDPATGNGTTKTTQAILIYDGAPVAAGAAKFVGDAILNAVSTELQDLAPRVSYVSTWAAVPAALAALPAGSMFIIPGTDDDLSAWKPGGAQAMTAASITAIKAWVTAGGRYMGICGGAIVAPATYVDASLGLNFPTLNLAPVTVDNFPNDTGLEHLETVDWLGGQSYDLYFQSGGVISRNASAGTTKFEIQAMYESISDPYTVSPAFMHDPGIAAIQYMCGAGKVYLSGVHFEATADYWDGSPPYGFTPHLELFEAAVVDMLSPRVLTQQVANMPFSLKPKTGATTWTNTKRKDTWVVLANEQNCVDAEVQKTFDTIIDSTYPASFSSIATVPVIGLNTQEEMDMYYDVMLFVFTIHFEFNPAQTKGIRMEGVAGSPLGAKVIIQKNLATPSLPMGKYEFTPVTYDSVTKTYSPSTWDLATHSRRECVAAKQLSFSMIPNGWIRSGSGGGGY